MKLFSTFRYGVKAAVFQECRDSLAKISRFGAGFQRPGLRGSSRDLCKPQKKGSSTDEPSDGAAGGAGGLPAGNLREPGADLGEATDGFDPSIFECRKLFIGGSFAARDNGAGMPHALALGCGHTGNI